MPPNDDDATMRLPPPRTQASGSVARRGVGLAVLGGGAALAAAVGGGLWLWRGVETAAPMLPATVADASAPAPPLLDMEGIAAHRAVEPTALRWSANPLVWVLDFPSLETQGAAMNRVAALIEKAGAPRDRVLDDAELAAAIAADRRTAANWYFGHNYRAGDVLRMFALAERQGIRLTPPELWLRAQVELSQRVDRGREAAILTIPGLGPQIDAQLRRTILRHELGHGQFFTLPFFAAHVMRVWEGGFTAAERADMRRFLAADGYDTAQEEMMANEAMAYLLYTPDRRFFNPARDLGWSDAQAERLRVLLRTQAPEAPEAP